MTGNKLSPAFEGAAHLALRDTRKTTEIKSSTCQKIPVFLKEHVSRNMTQINFTGGYKNLGMEIKMLVK